MISTSGTTTGQAGTSVDKRGSNKATRTASSWHPKSSAQICPAGKGSGGGENILSNLKEEWFQSQDEEDKILLQWFHNMCNGTYLEIGGLDGVALSNSHVFHFGLDWKGVLVEASPTMYPQLVQNRPNEIATIHAGVCETERTLHYVENWATGGFLEFTSAGFIDLWYKGEDIKNAIEITCQPLGILLRDTVGPNFHFDFFSLDIEGSELSALRSIDFTSVSFGIILVEYNVHRDELRNMALRTILETNGYIFLYVKNRSYWFVNKDFESIYKHLVL